MLSKIFAPFIWLFKKMKQNWKEAGGYAGKKPTDDYLKEENEYQIINDILN